MLSLSERAIAGAIVLVFWTGSTIHAQTLLQWNFQEGATYKNKATLRMKSELRGPQGRIETEVQQDYYMTVRITSVAPDGSAVLETTVDRLVMRVVLPDRGYTYDSEKGKMPKHPGDQQVVRALKTLVGATTVCRVDARGRVLEHKLPQAWNRLAQQNPAVKAMFTQLLSSDTPGNQVLPGLLVLPEPPVEKGDTWKLQIGKLTVPPISLEFTPSYTYLGRVRTDRGRCHKLGIKLRLKAAPVPGAPVSIEARSFSGKGEAYIDESLTYVVKSHAEQRAEFLIKANGQEIRQKVVWELFLDASPVRAKAR